MTTCDLSSGWDTVWQILWVAAAHSSDFKHQLSGSVLFSCTYENISINVDLLGGWKANILRKSIDGVLGWMHLLALGCRVFFLTALRLKTSFHSFWNNCQVSQHRCCALYLMNKLHGLEVSQKTDVHRVTHYPTQHFKSSESYCDTQCFS